MSLFQSKFIFKRKYTLVTCCITGIDLDEARRKREDNIVQLRKDKRDENLQKKRMVGTVVPQADEITIPEGGIMQQKVSRFTLPIWVGGWVGVQRGTFD